MFDPPDTTRDLQNQLVSLAAAIDTADTHVPRALRQNQRRHVRITIPRAKALVLCPNADEEIVELLDVSRGGACFRSQKIYSLGSWIRIAAPCTVSASNVFVLARLVRARIAEVGREYGVEYVRANR
jgi:hypothetical protein